MRKSINVLTFLLCSVVVTLSAKADVLTLKDGRVFEGTVRGNATDIVTIDAMVAGIRATLTFNRSQVSNLEIKPVPEGFYDQPKAEVSKVAPEKFNADDNLYLVVPMTGKLGETVFSDGVKSILAYAHRNDIKYLVFDVDLSGGTVDETKKLADLLMKQKRGLKYIAMVRSAYGSGLVIPVLSDEVVLMPGAVLGGDTESLKKLEGAVLEENLAMRASVARRTMEYLRTQGKSGLIAGAMIDPQLEVVAWVDTEGNPHIEKYRPEEVKDEQVVLESKQGELLKITTSQVAKLGLKEFSGTAADLGKRFNIESWVMESDYGLTEMQEHNKDKIKRQQHVHAKNEQQLARLISRRDELVSSFSHNVSMAARYDPSSGSYQTYTTSGLLSEGTHSNRMTNESREEWQRRSKTAMNYLKNAARDMKTIASVEDRGEKLGMKRKYTKQQTKQIIDDLDVKYRYLQANYNKRFK